MSWSEEVLSAHLAAKEARKRAHAPYSKFLVGAALKIADKEDFVLGCNVENASYGATVCAERTAFQVARATFGDFKPQYIVLVTDTSPAVPPCALCLQVMKEFCEPDFPVYVGNKQGIEKVYTLKELLPQGFGPRDLLG